MKRTDTNIDVFINMFIDISHNHIYELLGFIFQMTLFYF
jgi:hypothetical protein